MMKPNIKIYAINTDKLDIDPCPTCEFVGTIEDGIGCTRIEGSCFSKIWHEAQQSVFRYSVELPELLTTINKIEGLKVNENNKETT